MAHPPAEYVDAEAAYPRRKDGGRKVLVIACGALAREILALSSTRFDLALPAGQPAQSPRAHPRGDAGQDPRQP